MSGIQAFGVFVEVSPAVAGLVHVSELEVNLAADAASKWKVGDTMDVMVLDASSGKLALSRRAVLLADKGTDPAKALNNPYTSAANRRSADDSFETVRATPSQGPGAGAKRGPGGGGVRRNSM